MDNILAYDDRGDKWIDGVVIGMDGWVFVGIHCYADGLICG